MKTYTVVFLLIAILCASLLVACGEAKTPEAPVLESAATEAPAEAVAKTVAEPTAEPVEATAGAVRHITDTISEHHVIDADVFGPASEEVTQYRAAFLKVTPEKVIEVLCPGDTIATKETPADRDYTVADTAGGNHIRVSSGSVGFEPANDAHLEWYQMLAYSEFYLAEHPEEKTGELDFMTAGEAKALAAKALKDLGVGLEPEFVICAGLTAAEMNEYQKELRETNPEVAAIGFNADLSGTTEADDCYVMQVSFRYGGLPVLGSLNEPSVGMHGWSFPSSTHCEIIIGKEGIRYLYCVGLMETVEPLDSAKVISAEKALELFKAKAVNFDGQDEDHVVTQVFMEYVPVPDGETQILRPYWCVVMWGRQFLMEGSNMERNPSPRMGYAHGSRFNAYTGGDLADWE